MRINKYLKDKGLSTRRGADELIKAGAVRINGQVARLGAEVTSHDKVSIYGKTGVKEEKLYYIVYNKPIGVLTNRDEASGKDILSVTNFKDDQGNEIRVFPVGRLDKDSHGLILMTNDGRVTDKLLSPRFLHAKEYVVITDRPFNDFFLQKMADGIRIDGSVTRKAETERLSPNKFSIILTEGKKRQIRRMCEALHLDVVDLSRIRIMNIKIGKLKPGEYKHLSQEEKKILLKSLYLTEKETMMMAKKAVVKDTRPSAIRKGTGMPTLRSLKSKNSKKTPTLRSSKTGRPLKGAPRTKRK